MGAESDVDIFLVYTTKFSRPWQATRFAHNASGKLQADTPDFPHRLPQAAP